MECELTVIGVSHQTGGMALREALAPRPEEAGRLNASLRAAAGLVDVVALATCSRFEIYASLDEHGRARLEEALSRRAQRALGVAVYSHRGNAAIAHLLRVAAGLDSWVLGETEILGQVKAAYQRAQEEGTVTRPLHIAFQRALFVGKKVRTETAIVGGITSIGGAATMLASRVFGKLEERRVVVFGAGTMAASTVRHLRAKGLAELVLANRSPGRAAALAAELGGTPVSLEEGFLRLSAADIAVFSTSVSGYLFDEQAALRLSAERKGKPIFLVDLGLPRNVDPAATRAEGVFVYDMDDLRRMVQESLKRREGDLARASTLVAAETSDCWARIYAPPAAPPRARCPLAVEVPVLRPS